LSAVSDLGGLLPALKRFTQHQACLAQVEDRHEPKLAPTQEMLDACKKRKGSWQTYEREFNELMATRAIEQAVSQESIDFACLLCSEKKSEHCHRRLVAEYLKCHWTDLTITHLV
jgi:uncharacterized protein YeaO (DUF488 family)